MYKFWNDYECLLWILGYDPVFIDDPFLIDDYD